MAHRRDNEDTLLKDYVDDMSQMSDVSGTLEVVCKDLGDALERAYPGWAWTLMPNEEQGIINLFCIRLSGEFGWVFHIADVQGDDRHKKAVEAGGHILERYGITRGAYTPERWKMCRKDILGQPMADNSDQEGKLRRKLRDRLFDQAIREGKLEIQIKDIEAPHGGATRHISVREAPDATQ